MNALRILAAATAMEACAAAAILAVAGLGGSRNGWLDVINSFAPLILAMALFGAGLAWFALDRGAVRTAALCLAVIGALCSLAQIAPEFAGQTRAGRSGDGPKLRVLSANVWTENPSPDLAVAKILATDADAVLLQEVDGTLANPLAGLKSRYPYASDCPGSGVRIYVKQPILAQGCSSPPRPGALLDLVWIRTTAPDGRTFTLATTHLRRPLPPGPQALQRSLLADQLRALPGADLILAGDFNTAPWTFAMRRQDASFAPLRRRTIAWVTWPARINLFNRVWPAPFLPIDHLYAAPSWKSVTLTRLRMPGSDHFATEAVLGRAS